MQEITDLARFREAVADDPVARARARNRLVNRALGHEPSRRGPNRHPSRRWRLVVATAATAAVAIGGAVAVDSLRAEDQPADLPADATTAVALLQQAADVAIGATDPEVSPDEYLHVTTVAVYASGISYGEDDVDYWLETYTEELFIPGDSANEWVLRRSARVPYRPEDAELAQQHDVRVDDPFAERARDGAFFGGQPPVGTWSSPNPEFLDSLPRDPEPLLDQIRQAAGGDGLELNLVAELLRTGIVPGALRAALFQAMASIPEIELIDEQANLNGQVGVAVGQQDPEDELRREIIFNPDTGHVIGEREVVLDHDMGFLIPAGTPYGWTAVTTDVVPASDVDAIPADPME
jgi:hypothetical protein